MSKYPVQYQSASKGPVDIESMATPHLANAWRKLRDEVVGKLHPTDPKAQVLSALAREMESRGCRYEDGARWVFPPKEGQGP